MKRILLVMSLILVLSIVSSAPPSTQPQSFYGSVTYNGAELYDGCSMDLKSQLSTATCAIKSGEYGYSPICSIVINDGEKVEFFIENVKVGEQLVKEKDQALRLDFNLTTLPTCAVPPLTTTTSGGGGGGGGGSHSSTTVKPAVVNTTNQTNNTFTNLGTNSSDLSGLQSTDTKTDGSNEKNFLSSVLSGDVATLLVILIAILIVFVFYKASSRSKQDKSIQAEISKIAHNKDKKKG